MWKAIDLNKIDELLKDYKAFKHKRETFSEFIDVSGLIRDDGIKIPDWDWVDSVGVVTPQDFEEVFDKEYVEDNFDDLAHTWFNGLNGQIDFGILLDCVKDEPKFKKGLKGG